MKVAEYLSLIEENKVKIQKLEETIEKMISPVPVDIMETGNVNNPVDEIELECKIDEYKKLKEFQKIEIRKLLVDMGSFIPNVDNKNFQMILTSQKIDDQLVKIQELVK